MDWQDLAGALVRAGAPIIGTALGGPFGGMIGSAVGDVLARALGTAATPQAIGEALRVTPSADLAARLSAADSEAAAKWPALAEIARAEAEIGRAQVAEVAATQRAEIAAGDPLQRWWRPIYALELSMLECPAFALVLLHALWSGHEAGINGFAQLSALLMTYFGARFGVLGVYVSGRTREKQAAIAVAAPSIVAQSVKAIVKRRP
ncbi:MAG: hypothetical protein HY056_00335 [Proteobacteria bacterium]|nr:hypothetical protein [Pseudomonadota bacterium]